MTARTAQALVADLRELVEAIDRRMPGLGRDGEPGIARDAATLKHRALALLATLEGSI